MTQHTLDLKKTSSAQEMTEKLVIRESARGRLLSLARIAVEEGGGRAGATASLLVDGRMQERVFDLQ